MRIAGTSRSLACVSVAGAALLVPAMAFGQDVVAATQATAEAAAEAVAAPDAAAAVSAELFTTNNVWMMLATGLVLIMHLGFATLEAGLCRAKNCVNILTKNTAIPLIGLITYYAIGFNMMYPGDAGWMGGHWFGLAAPYFGITTDAAGVTSAYNVGYTYWTDFLFQAMFCATACTIVSGAVAERVKLAPFLVFAVVLTAVIYPLVGSWKWGNGWLNRMDVPFVDFAGSTLVHSVGGWAALAGVLLLGPRIGKYTVDGKVNAIPGHNMPLAVIGVFLLFLGWFGFNGGSVLSADPALTSLVLVTTSLAAAAGGLAALLTSVFVLKAPDLSMTLNGILAGLVGITAGADLMGPGEAIIIGLVAGVLVVLSVLFFDKIRVDDPVGALSVHLVCGIWGTLAVGVFGSKAGGPQLVSQLVGIATIGAATFGLAVVVLAVLKAATGIRVSPEEEVEGLDIGEHGMHAYPDFTTDVVTTGPTASSAGVTAAVAHA